MNPEADDRNTGSMLVEALVGVGMLALITASLVPFNRSLISASEAVEVRVAALELADQHVQHEVLSQEPTLTRLHQHPRRSLSSTVATWEDSADPGDRCRRPGRSVPRGVSTDVRAVDGESGATILTLRSTRLEQVRHRSGSTSGRIAGSAVRITGDGSEGLEVIIETVSGPIGATVDQFGCLELPDLPPGRHVVRPVPSGLPLVDAAHRDAHATGLMLEILDRPVRRDWQLAQAVELTVEIVHSGSRPPDEVNTGTLRWMLRGDDSRSARESGSTRLVHPGRTTIVVSACENPEAAGSTVTVDLQSGETRQVAVPLAEVVLYGLVGREGEAVYAVRTNGCADESGSRAALRWIGALSDGMRIALPHGEWEARVETASGTRITAPVRVAAGEPGASATFP